MYFGLSKQSKLSLDQGQFLMKRRLNELNFKVSKKITPGDGSCMFHALLDQIQSIPDLEDYASSHYELRWKIVSDGYKLFLETEKLSWPDGGPDWGSKKNWKNRMLDPHEWGDEIVLSLASNLLELDIVIIPAFRESSCDQVSGVTTIKPLISAKHQPIHLFCFSDSDFISPHYQSVWPRSEHDIPSPSSLHPTIDFEVADVDLTEETSIMTEEDIRNCEFVMTEESIRDFHVVVTTNTHHSKYVGLLYFMSCLISSLFIVSTQSRYLQVSPASPVNQLQSRKKEEDHQEAKTRRKMKHPGHHHPSIHPNLEVGAAEAAEDGVEVEAVVLQVG